MIVEHWHCQKILIIATSYTTELLSSFRFDKQDTALMYVMSLALQRSDVFVILSPTDVATVHIDNKSKN